MSKKTLIWIGLFAGSAIGSYIPALWGSDMFSLSSVLLSAIGGLAGVWFGFQIGE